MLTDTALDVAAADDWPGPVEVLNEAGASPVVLLCEHASNHMPAEFARLGLPPAELERHIAWDIGAAAVTRRLADLIDAPAFLGTYSRLLIDLNRPTTAASCIPARSEATDVPGNIGLDPAERQRRIDRIFTPYHARVAAHLDARAAAGRPTTLVTIHSFTPVFLGVSRPWHVGILFDRSRAFGEALVARLAQDSALVVGANEPYVIYREEDYAVPVHGEDRGHDAVLVEIRNDLIAAAPGPDAWAERLATVIADVVDGAGRTRAPGGSE